MASSVIEYRITFVYHDQINKQRTIACESWPENGVKLYFTDLKIRSFLRRPRFKGTFLAVSDLTVGHNHKTLRRRRRLLLQSLSIGGELNCSVRAAAVSFA